MLSSKNDFFIRNFKSIDFRGKGKVIFAFFFIALNFFIRNDEP